MQHASLSIGWLSTVASVGYYFIIVLTSTLDSLGWSKRGFSAQQYKPTSETCTCSKSQSLKIAYQNIYEIEMHIKNNKELCTFIRLLAYGLYHKGMRVKGTKAFILNIKKKEILPNGTRCEAFKIYL